MSGTGKSSVVRALTARGYKAVDTDDGWCEPLPDGRQRWDEDLITELLDTEDTSVLFVAGCEENQVVFHPRFDVVVLLSAPLEAMLLRLAERRDNSFGKSADERRRVLEDTAAVEPRLRAVADHEVRTTGDLDSTVDQILRLLGLPDRVDA
jgi:dephospho-CoA kinase